VSGPREATSPQSQGPRGNLTSDVSLPKTALALWPAKLLTLLNPCVPDLHFTRHEGKNQVTYTDEREKDGFGNYTGNHKTTYEMDEDDDADDEDGNHYHGQKHTPSVIVAWSRTNPYNGKVTSSVAVYSDGTKGRCVTTYNPNTDQTTQRGKCDFDMDPTNYDIVITEDPFTGEAVLTVNATGLVSVCPVKLGALQPATTPALAMLETTPSRGMLWTAY
jgi:hypothetical protein